MKIEFSCFKFHLYSMSLPSFILELNYLVTIYSLLFSLIVRLPFFLVDGRLRRTTRRYQECSWPEEKRGVS